MNLIKTSILTGIQATVRISSSILLNKIIAIYVGPAGYAIMGQFQNFITLLTSLAGGVISTGVTKATATHHDNITQQTHIWQTAIRFSLWSSTVLGLFLLILSRWLASSILNKYQLYDVFIWLAITLPILTLNNILLAIVNGKKETRIFVISNILGGICTVALIILMTILFGLHGILISYTISPVIILVITILFIRKKNWFSIKSLWGKINEQALKKLAGFALMGLLSALIIPFSLIIIRNELTNKLGMEIAGYWQATWKISEIYLTLVTGSLTVYYLPRLAEIHNSKELKFEIISVYKFILPIISIGAILIYILRDFIIHTMLTKEFIPMRNLFFWQLVGDVLKIGSWVLAYVMVGRAMIKTYLISEFCLWSAFTILSLIGINWIGVEGVTIAYALTYGLFWIVMIFLIKKEMILMDSKMHPKLNVEMG